MSYNLRTRPFSSHSWIVQWIRPQSDVLDIGCASGYFARAIAQKQCRVVGVEKDPKSAERAKDHCTQVFTIDVEQDNPFPWKEKTFDYIICADILEHLVDPWSVLARLKWNLRPNGRVIISIPNVANWQTRAMLFTGSWKYSTSGLMDKTHLRFFTRNSARELIMCAGLKIKYEEVAPNPSWITHGLANLHTVHQINYRIARAWPTLFAQQFIFDASLA